MKVTYKFFQEERIRFREVMSSREIMTDIDRRSAALQGYAYVYMRTETNQPIESFFKADVDEFSRRCAYLDMQTIL